jgi:hypothetical protein
MTIFAPPLWNNFPDEVIEADTPESRVYTVEKTVHCLSLLVWGGSDQNIHVATILGTVVKLPDDDLIFYFMFCAHAHVTLDWIGGLLVLQLEEGG